MPFCYLHFECSVSHTLDYSSINRDHIFFWNNVTSFHPVTQAMNPGDIMFSCLAYTTL